MSEPTNETLVIVTWGIMALLIVLVIEVAFIADGIYGRLDGLLLQ